MNPAPLVERWVGRVSDFVKRLVDRPVLATVVLGLIYVIVQAWWIHRARFVGGLDVDEAGGIANALTFHRLLFTGLRPLTQAVTGQGNGPLVPVLAVPFLIVGPRSVNSAMVLQPVLAAVAAVGAAGITRRIAGKWAAVIAGFGVLCLPAIVVSSRSFQNSLGVAAFLSLALWALTASDRCRRLWPMIGFGVATGAMMLSRTMSAGFVPALVLAGLITTAWEWRSIRNLAIAGLAAVAVAGPWWLRQWDVITGYLVENAYGGRAGYWGPESITGRLGANFDNFARNFAISFPALPFLAVILGAVSLWHWRRTTGEVRTWPGWNRNLAAVWVVVAVGYLALMSTSNMGFWFSTPLDIMAIVGLAGLVGATQTAPVSVPLIRWTVFGVGALMTIGLMAGMGRQGWAVTAFVLVVATALWCDPNHWQRTMGASVVGIGLVAFAVSLSPVGAGGKLGPDAAWTTMFVNDLDFLQGGNLNADIRMGSSDLSDRKRAAAAWQEASHQVAGELAALDAQGTYVETIVGSMHLMNANTIGIAAELYPRGRHDLRTVNTLEPSDEEIAESLPPMVGPDPRVFVIIEGRSLPFPDDRGWPRLVQLAEDDGWIVHSTTPLPDGGRVVIYTHPDSIWSAPPAPTSAG